MKITKTITATTMIITLMIISQFITAIVSYCSAVIMMKKYIPLQFPVTEDFILLLLQLPFLAVVVVLVAMTMKIIQNNDNVRKIKLVMTVTRIR